MINITNRILYFAGLHCWRCAEPSVAKGNRLGELKTKACARITYNMTKSASSCALLFLQVRSNNVN